jgi:hypothetical protein
MIAIGSAFFGSRCLALYLVIHSSHSMFGGSLNEKYMLCFKHYMVNPMPLQLSSTGYNQYNELYVQQT